MTCECHDPVGHTISLNIPCCSGTTVLVEPESTLSYNSFAVLGRSHSTELEALSVDNIFVGLRVREG